MRGANQCPLRFALLTAEGSAAYSSDISRVASRRTWHFPMLPPCPRGVPIVEPGDQLPTHDPDRPYVVRTPDLVGGVGMLLPNNQRQHRTLHIQNDALPYVLC